MNRTIVITGIILILLGIILGAFGAHALKSVLTESKLASFETGVRYQILHGIALLSIGLNASLFKFSLVGWYRIIFIGIICFSLSIYLLALQDLIRFKLSFLGPVTPLGGTLMIIGWLILLLRIFRNK